MPLAWFTRGALLNIPKGLGVGRASLLPDPELGNQVPGPESPQGKWVDGSGVMAAADTI